MGVPFERLGPRQRALVTKAMTKEQKGRGALDYLRARSKSSSMPNATEAKAAAVLRLPEAIFEGREFCLDNGHNYTPDWWCPEEKIAVEVKSEHIYSRDSRILFDGARMEHPEITWVWARKRKKGRKGPRWEIEVYDRQA